MLNDIKCTVDLKNTYMMKWVELEVDTGRSYAG